MITIFAGPTISDPEIKHVLPDARVLPPAAVGDIYAAAKSEPAGIGLIDGYFDGTPSVWHKEVLYALDAGIPVFGASSMGALRAAECHVFGMVGIGRIFEQCRDGLLDDDDEVAVIHGPAELGYVLLSEPMVNIRATLAVSVDAGVLSAAMASRLAELAKSILYPDRSWERLRDEAERLGIDPQALDRFDAWRATGYVDQKRLDAVEMLHAIERHLREGAERIPASFVFRHTAMWRDLVFETEDASIPIDKVLILDILRQDRNRFLTVKRRVAERMTNDDGFDDAAKPETRAVDEALNRFRSRNRLFTAAALNDWLAENRLDLGRLRDRLAREIAADTALARSSDFLEELVFEAVSEDPDYADMLHEAARQKTLLLKCGYSSRSGPKIGLEPIELLIWYFKRKLEQPVPDDLDAYLSQFGFRSRDQFERMMVRQFIVWQDKENARQP